MYKIYEVQDGDTLDSIANQLNITKDVLMTLNGITQNTALNKGTYIVVPNEETAFIRYTVKSGDNMHQIAKTYNTTAQELIKLNGLNQNDYIYPGDEIIVPNKNTSFYITEQGDTLNKVTTTLNTTANNLNNQNKTIYLMSDQLIISQK